MRKIFNKYQLVVPVIKNVNYDEFDSEIKMILAEIHRCKTFEDVYALVYRTFVKQFGTEDAGPKEKYFDLSKEVYFEFIKQRC